MRGLIAICTGLGLLVSPLAPALAQDTVTAVSPAQVVIIIDPDALFTGTLFGKRILADIDAQTKALVAENADIVAQLTDEEADLAARRPAMDPVAFRAEADAFEAKTEEIRAAQKAKEDAINTTYSQARLAFDDQVRPVLGELMRARGATILLARRDVLLFLSSADITSDAIAAVDAALGDGSLAAN